MTMTIGTWHADRADDNGMGSTYTQNTHRMDQPQQVIFHLNPQPVGWDSADPFSLSNFL